MQVRLYSTLRDIAGAKVVEVATTETSTVGAVLASVSGLHPALGAKIWDASGALSGAVKVLVNGRMVEFLQGLDTPIRPADSIQLFPPIGGG
jgi:sulfur-carrier protein